MRTGLELLELSRENPEPLLDSCYASGDLIISRDPQNPNELMMASVRLREFITTYKVCREQGNEAACRDQILQIANILNSENINKTEFVGFWSTQDMSHSLFRSLSADDKEELLQQLIERFLDQRYDLFDIHGYSHTTLQARKDAFSHKGYGELGGRKMSAILNGVGFQETEPPRMNAMPDGERLYFFASRRNKEEFLHVLDMRGYRFEWYRNYARRNPDYVLALGNKICVFEHKHVKEDGSGQNSQIKQLIDLISGVEEDANIHYVAYLDGIYFNTIFCREQENLTPRQRDQKRMVIDALETTPSNYFLNTAGVRAFLSDLVAGD